jgi:hypothetical protein
MDRPIGSIELIYSVPPGAEPPVLPPIYGDGIDLPAHEGTKIGSPDCPDAVVESAHCGVDTVETIAPLVVPVGTPSKPLVVGAVYGDV